MAALAEIPKAYDSTLGLCMILGMNLGLLLVFLPLYVIATLTS